MAFGGDIAEFLEWAKSYTHLVKEEGHLINPQERKKLRKE